MAYLGLLRSSFFSFKYPRRTESLKRNISGVNRGWAAGPPTNRPEAAWGGSMLAVTTYYTHPNTYTFLTMGKPPALRAGGASVM